MTMVGDRGKGEEHQPQTKKHDTYNSDGQKFVCYGNTEMKTEFSQKGGCYICGDRMAMQGAPN